LTKSREAPRNPSKVLGEERKALGKYTKSAKNAASKKAIRKKVQGNNC